MTKRIVVRLQGGLGNQMFQYAFAYNLSKKISARLFIDTHLFYKKRNQEKFTKRDFELIFFKNNYVFFISNLPFHTFFDYYLYKIITLLKLKLYSYKTFNEIDITNIEFSNYQNIYLTGYYQDYKFFFDENIIRNIYKNFKFQIPLSERNVFFLNKIKSTLSVSIHIRRSDYLNINNITTHGVCTLDYYMNSINYFLNNYKDLSFFIFTDDINWAKNNIIKYLPQFDIIDHNNGCNAYLDLYLMSNCNHNIIANSTFSWWAAWLNKNINKKVIAPKQWFVHDKEINPILPSQWIKF
jgi:hypothetical protein